MKKSLRFVLAMMLISGLLLSACAPAATPEPPAAPPQAPAPPTQPPPPPEPTQPPPPPEPSITKVNFWHSMAGDIGGKAIPQMTNDFNASQNTCYVV
jgi:ABC-type glycerol-3-phosphate transport system substrate-binding protein